MRFSLMVLMLFVISAIVIAVEQKGSRPHLQVSEAKDIPFVQLTGRAPPDWRRDAEKALTAQKTPSGVRFSTKLRMRIGVPEVGTTRIDVPVGYLKYWAMPRDIDQGLIHEWETLSFAFWMPDRSVVLRKGPTLELYRVGPEPGHENPADNEFVVAISMVKFGVLANEPKTLSARTMIKNYLGSWPEIIFVENFHGLKRLELGLLGSESGSLIKNDTDDLAAIFQCFTHVPNPACRGFVHFAKDDVGFLIIIPLSGLPYWREAVETAHSMIIEWRDAAAQK